MISVEFMGIPGAGKSSIKDDLVDKLKSQKRSIYSMEEALLVSMRRKLDDRVYGYLLKLSPDWYALQKVLFCFDKSSSKFNAQNRFLAEYPDSFEAFLGAKHFNRRPSEEKALIISWFLGPASRYQIINEQLNQNQAVIFDEGFIQKSMSLFLDPSFNDHELNKDSLFHYLNNVPLPDFAIYVEADVDQCMDRINSRPRGLPIRLQDVNTKEVLSFLIKAKKHFGDLCSWLEGKGKTVIRLSNDGSVADATKELLSKLANEDLL
jgi:thymidylate kinase